MKKTICLAFVLFFATMAAAIDSRAQFTLISGNANQTVKAGEFIDPMVFRARYVEAVVPTIVNGLELQCPHDIIAGEYFDCTLSGRVTTAASGKYDMVFDYFDAKGDSATLYVPITVVGMSADIERLSGDSAQTINAGEAIQPIVYRYRNMTRVFVDSVPVGITLSIDESSYTFTISGKTQESSANRTFNFKIKGIIEDPETSTVDTAYAEGTITLNKTPGMVSFEVIENETQSVKPGQNTKPIVVKYNAGIQSIVFESEGIPEENFTAAHYASDRTIKLTTTVPEDYLDGCIKLRVIGTKDDGTEDTVIAVIHVIGNIEYTKMLILENAEQTVAPGDSIQPIILRYLNITEAPQAEDIVKGFKAVANKADQTIKVTGMIPKNTRDTTLQMSFIAIGENGTDTARVTLHIVHKPVTTTVVFVGDEATQYVKAGDTIKPFVFKHENAMTVRARGTPKYSSFSIETDKETNQSYLHGSISDSAAFGQYTITFIAEGLDNDASAEVTLVVMKDPVLTLISGNVNQTVAIGDSIEPLVYKYANLTKAGAKLFEGLNMISDAEAKTLTVYGKAGETNFYGEHTITVEAECFKLTASTQAKITIVAPQSSSSSVSSSSVSSSSVSSSSVSSSSVSSSSVSSSSVSSSSVSSSSVSSSSVSSSSVSSSSVSSSSVSSSSVSSSSVSSSSVSSSSVSSSSVSSSSVSTSSSAASSSSEKVKESSNSATSSSSSKKAKESSSSVTSSSSSEKAKKSSSSSKSVHLAGIPAVTSLRVSLEGRTLRIGGAEWANVDVFDMQGRPVARFVQVKNAVSLESLHQGNYIVRVRSKSNSLTRQILIK